MLDQLRLTSCRLSILYCTNIFGDAENAGKENVRKRLEQKSRILVTFNAAEDTYTCTVF